MAKQKSILGNGDQNFAVKVLLDQVLREAENLNPNVKEFIVKARDEVWNQHIKEQESQMPEWKKASLV